MNCEGSCRLTIAGPGAGKTTQMIDDIEKSLEYLEAHRFCAVITYTNEATKEIKKRLRQNIKLPPNLFVGTIHSFLINFILEPYAHLYSITTVEKVYIDEVKLSFEIDDRVIRDRYIKKQAEKILDYGLVTYDKILEKSYNLTENNRICTIIANRLQYIFIDEYQDSRVLQHLIMLNILKKGKTNIYAIGDPMQSIFNFTYEKSQLKDEPTPDENTLPPIRDLQRICIENSSFNYSEITQNHRCSPQITDFINNFNGCITQETDNTDKGIPVHFISETDLRKILKCFFHLKAKYDIPLTDDGTITNLFLSRYWDTFDKVAGDFGLLGIATNGCESKSIYKDAERCILSVLGITLKSLYNGYGIDNISFRKFAIKMVKKIKLKEYENADSFQLKKDIISSINHEFNISIKLTEVQTHIGVESTIRNTFFRSCDFEFPSSFYSTIHSAKGLEASSVLVVAETKNLFKKWIKTSPDEILDFKNDNARLGFVGFSRAIDFLCVACLEEAADLIKFPDVEVYPQPDGRRQFKLTDF